MVTKAVPGGWKSGWGAMVWRPQNGAKWFAGGGHFVAALPTPPPHPTLTWRAPPLSEQRQVLFPQLLEPWSLAVPISGGP